VTIREVEAIKRAAQRLAKMAEDAIVRAHWAHHTRCGPMHERITEGSAVPGTQAAAIREACVELLIL
jgi:hypothetical protein